LRGNKRESELKRRRKQPSYELFRNEPVMSRLNEMLSEPRELRNRPSESGERKKQRRPKRRPRWKSHSYRLALNRCSRKNTSWLSKLRENGLSSKECSGTTSFYKITFKVHYLKDI
jgi:hypothetical protein